MISLKVDTVDPSNLICSSSASGQCFQRQLLDYMGFFALENR